MAPSIVIAAGGTGGHIYPGLALARALGRAAPGGRVSFVGTARGLEGRLIPEAGYELDLVDMVPFTGWRRAVLPAALVRAAVQARSILHRRQADVAVGMGGYASIPLIVGARLAAVPALIHESGAVPGKANLVAARLTGNVATAFDEVVDAFPASATVRTVGMPLGPELAGFDRAALRHEARRAFGLDEGTRLVLVSGGSQGAATLNRLAVGLAQRWRDRGDVRILVKAGARNHEEAQAAVRATGTEKIVEVTRFIERMDHAYAAADVAVCRPGAGTVAELAVVGLPAVLVPYPHAPSDHQARNAAALVEAGAAFLVRDHQATAEVVGPLLERVLDDASELERMGSALRSIAHPRAAEELAAWALELAGTTP
ncbi:MAG: UDP-N-acetylglucosamine--N-acetylmuramyl-(pentapeptide) pyrophosphoryl-undecaprenol N-acetylglucosamine transferase [Actinomycetota bacterium]|nr:UDP-N-acetylglucosamine--N-acetylmuramyl-(pentapeptide) pyrophosphoryl-undecaprenol N-acetylglucosamine transferase [Actinomycetota bacterium]